MVETAVLENNWGGGGKQQVLCALLCAVVGTTRESGWRDGKQSCTEKWPTKSCMPCKVGRSLVKLGHRQSLIKAHESFILWQRSVTLSRPPPSRETESRLCYMSTGFGEPLKSSQHQRVAGRCACGADIAESFFC